MCVYAHTDDHKGYVCYANISGGKLKWFKLQWWITRELETAVLRLFIFYTSIPVSMDSDYPSVYSHGFLHMFFSLANNTEL